MSTATAPPAADLKQVADSLHSVLAAGSAEAEELRRLPADTVDALTGSGLARLRIPARHGGHEADNRTTAEVIRSLAKADGSAGWTAAVWAISSWMSGLFPDSVQNEIFDAPHCRISGILSPGGTIAPTEDGYVLNGRWSFNTGVTQSNWNTLAAVIEEEDGLSPVMVAVPTDEVTIDDDWHTSGMRGSGSVSVVADGVRVPAGFVLPMGPAIAGAPPTNSNASSPMFHTPFMVAAGITVGAVAVGLAEAAYDAFLERLPGRGITYTDYSDQSQAPVTHLQLGHAAQLVEEARMHIRTAAEVSDHKAQDGDAWELPERVRMRLLLGAATRRAREAVDLLANASGGSSSHLDVPIQRVRRDMHTLSLHAVMNPDTNDELFGRVACGLPPNTVYL